MKVTVLVIHVDKVVVEVEGQLQAVGELDLDVTAVTVDGVDLYPGEIAVDVGRYLLGNYPLGKHG